MIKTLTAAMLAAAAALPASAQPPAAPAPTATAPAATTPTVSITPERLARIRQALLSQIAVYDAGEGAMRAPTAAEAAALAGTPGAAAGRTEQVIALPGGGAALRADASSLSFLVVETQGDGKVAVRHGAPKSKSQPAQGGAHVR